MAAIKGLDPDQAGRRHVENTPAAEQRTQRWTSLRLLAGIVLLVLASVTLAISITYCDQTDFARVFSDPGTDKPLKLRTAGWMKKQLALQVGSPDHIHLHDDKTIPLDDYPFVRVPFGQWRSEHPDGLVYGGGIDWEASEETRSGE